jgi:hypothetical protein
MYHNNNMLNENKQTLLYIKTNDDRLLTMMTTTVVSLVNSGYVASEQTTKKTPRSTIRLLLSTYLLPGNTFTELLVSNLEATTYIANFNILTLPSSQQIKSTNPLILSMVSH